MHKLLSISILFLSLNTFAQLTTDADFKRQVYDKEMSGGFMLHSRGYALNVRKMNFTDGYTKWGWEVDIAMIRHPKEVKFQSQYYFSSSRSFVYGKLNGLYTFRTGFGRDKVLVDKTDKGTISISWVTMGGPSFGMLKPVYLEVAPEDNPNGPLITERYNPEVHDFADISGQAPFFTGISKSSLRMGLYLKTGFAFDFNLSDKKVTTIEVGAIADYFPPFGSYKEKELPIMYEAENYNLWFQFYITLNFGGKWN